MSGPDDFDDDFVELCEICEKTPEMCICHAGDDCGRWINGRLTASCSKAGSEDCDFECPYRDTLYGATA